ncbi:uncharacterized protein LOC143809467 [Ranitomeya variabilis]|uniref:uncharacterized protein LOC143809467 n=1 Tax=Ranitomeya variabilis TaxID=490064 RepID=UPI00405616A3
MVEPKAVFSLLLVAGFHLSYSAPVDIPKPLQDLPTNIHSIEVLATILSIPSVPTQKQPTVLPTGGASNAPTPAGGNLVSSNAPRLVSVTGVKSTGSPVVVTSRPDNNSSQPVSPSNGVSSSITTPGSSSTTTGSVTGHNVAAAGPSVTPRADAHPSTVTGTVPIFNVNNRNISTFPIHAFTDSQPNNPVSSGIRPPIVNGPEFNPCPDQCPNGIIGNPPCICAIPGIQV